ncbi:hypothetical protein BO71DRAFT_400510, partial [Aspergillus ellipticus CBS 707.79]
MVGAVGFRSPLLIMPLQPCLVHQIHRHLKNSQPSPRLHASCISVLVWGTLAFASCTNTDLASHVLGYVMEQTLSEPL